MSSSTRNDIEPPAWGLSALQDQQLGGLIMWVPGGVVFLAAALVLAHGWLGSEPALRRSPIPAPGYTS